MVKHEWKRYGMTLILSGPSGSGKSSIYKKAFEEISGFAFSVSCTTRQPRPGEVNGVDYHFISKEEFEEKIRQNAFVEYAQVHGNYYGTLKSELYERMQQGIDVLLDIDVQGAMQIRKACETDPELRKSCEFVFLSPPSSEELERRLRKPLVRRLRPHRHSSWKPAPERSFTKRMLTSKEIRPA